MASPYAMDLGNVLGTVDSVRTAQMQRQQFDLERQQFEQQQEDRQRLLGEQNALKSARKGVAGGDFSALMAIAPEEAVSIQKGLLAMSEVKRARAIEQAKEATEIQGKIAAYVLAPTDPQQRAQRYSQVRQNLPEGLRKSMPAEFSEEWTNFALAKAAGMDHLLSEIARGREIDILGNALAPQQGVLPPMGEWGAPAGASEASGAAPEGFTLRKSQFDPLFEQAEQEFRLPRGYLARTAEIESGLNPTAKNPNSSASGLFQFIGSTAKHYDVGNPLDPEQSTIGAARLAADNVRVLREALGREPTAAELYLAHQQGGTGAARLLAAPNARAVDIVGEDAVRLNGGSPDMTAGEFASKWLAKFGVNPGDPRNNPLAQSVAVAMASPDVSEPARNVLADLYTRLAPPPAAPPDLMNLSPGSTVFDPATQQPVFTAPRAEQGSAAEQQIARLVETGLPREVAIGIADGRLRTDRHPVTGELQVVDIGTGQVVYGQRQQAEQAAQQVAEDDPAESTSTMPADVDYAGATGTEGFVSSLANTVSEIVGGGLIAPENERAIQALSNLQVRTQVDLAEGVAGRPSNYLLERLDRLAVQPGSPFQGPGRARERLAQTRDMIDEAIRENMEMSSAEVDGTTRAQARANIIRLRRLRDDYDRVLEGFGTGAASSANRTSSGVQWSIEE